MSSLLFVNAQHVNADTSPVAPASMSSEVPAAEASPYEFFGEPGEYGGIGQLFGAEPTDWVPRHLEQTSPAPEVDVSTNEAMKIDNASQGPQGDPNAPTQVAAKPAGGFNLAEQIKSGAALLREGVVHLMLEDPEVMA